VIGCLALLLSLVAVGQEASIVQCGTWTATAGPSAAQVMRGSWSAETLSGARNLASPGSNERSCATPRSAR
jgi:hypothetical protein